MCIRDSLKLLSERLTGRPALISDGAVLLLTKIEEARARHTQLRRGGRQLPILHMGEHTQHQTQQNGQTHRQVRAVE